MDDVVKARRELSKTLSDRSANWLRGYREGLQTASRLFAARHGMSFTGTEVAMIIDATLMVLPDEVK